MLTFLRDGWLIVQVLAEFYGYLTGGDDSKESYQ
jgi:hypothetical protein